MIPTTEAPYHHVLRSTWVTKPTEPVTRYGRKDNKDGELEIDWDSDENTESERKRE